MTKKPKLIERGVMVAPVVQLSDTEWVSSLDATPKEWKQHGAYLLDKMEAAVRWAAKNKAINRAIRRNSS